MARRFVIPDELARAAGNEGRGDWLVGLPVLVAQIAADWQIHIGDPLVPGGATSWVAPGRDHAGTDVVLKVCWPHPGAAHEADGLGTWAGDGAIRLYKATELAEASVLLLERCRPGTQPQQAGRDRSPAWRQRQPVVVAPEANLDTGANTTVHPWCEQYMLELTVAS